MRQEMLTLSGTHDFTPFGEFKISPIHDRHLYTLRNLSVLGLCLRTHAGGLHILELCDSIITLISMIR